MKKTLYYITLVSILLLTTASSCTKDDEPDEPQLPTGENTMYYYIDGELVIPEDRVTGGIHDPAISYTTCDDETIYIYTTSGLVIYFYNGVQNTGEIILNQGHYDSCEINDNHAFFHTTELWDDGVYHTTFYYTQNSTGTVNISYLSDDKKHFKGAFEMTVYHENTGAEKHISEGHFNINLNTLNE